MRILVIGGTRFIGAALVQRLVNLGHDVAVLNRGETPVESTAPFTRLVGNRECLVASRPEIEKFAPEVVLHNVVIHDEHMHQALDACRGIAKRMVMTSSCDVYRAYGRLTGKEPGPPDPTPLTESSPLREVPFPYRDQVQDESHPIYKYDKIPAERALLADPDFESVVLRLPMVWGPNDYQHRLFPFFKPMDDDRPAIVLSEEYANWKSTYGFAENVSECMTLACLHPKASGVYNVADWSLSGLEQAEAVKRRMRWEGEIIVRPASELPDVFHAGINTEQDLVCSSRRIRTELGYQPLFHIDDAIDHTLHWELDHLPDPIPEGVLNYAEVDEVLAKVKI